MKENKTLILLSTILIELLIIVAIDLYYEVPFDKLNSKDNYEIGVLDQKVAYFKSNYNVLVRAYEDASNLNDDFEITPIFDYEKITNAISKLEDFYLLFNKEFFQNFYKDGMNGIDIYFASDIKGIKNGFENTAVVGLYFKKNSKYNIVVNINDEEQITSAIAHETMHMIDDYLYTKDRTIWNWNNFNPSNFRYENTYYIKNKFNDTLSNGTNASEIYFIDNYARSSESEDKARLFEAIINQDNLTKYPNLKAKSNYLKSVLTSEFPELNNTKIFKPE